MTMLFLGWFGTFAYLANHAYISLIKKWQPKVYFTGNLVAATSLTVQSVYLSSWQAAAINGFWMLISVFLLSGVKMDSFNISSKLYFWVSGILVATVLSTSLWLPNSLFYSVLGWSSAYFFCSSYFLFSAKQISSRAYLALNIYAALALLPQLWLSGNYPVFTLEIAWAAVSLIGIVRSYQDVHLID